MAGQASGSIRAFFFVGTYLLLPDDIRGWPWLDILLSAPFCFILVPFLFFFVFNVKTLKLAYERVYLLECCTRAGEGYLFAGLL